MNRTPDSVMWVRLLLLARRARVPYLVDRPN